MGILAQSCTNTQPKSSCRCRLMTNLALLQMIEKDDERLIALEVALEKAIQGFECLLTYDLSEHEIEDVVKLNIDAAKKVL